MKTDWLGTCLRFARSRLGVVLGVALLVRVLWIALCPNEPVSDQGIYHHGARNILSGAGFAYETGGAIGFWPVGYSAALAGVYAVLGVHYLSAYAFNALLGVATAGVTYALAKKLYDERVGLAAAWAMALYPSFILYTTVIASENLYTPLWMAAVLFAVLAQGERSTRWIVACGVASGLATQVRPTAFVFPLLVVGAALLWRRGLKRGVLEALGVTLIVLAMGFPWALRNQRVFGDFSFQPFNGGVVLFIGNHAGADGQNISGDLTHLGAPDADSMSLPEYDRRLQKLAVEYIRSHPGDFLRLMALRTYHTLKAETIAVVWNGVGIEKAFGARALTPLKLVTTLGYGVLMLGGLAALARCALRRRITRSELLLLGAVLLAAIPFLVVLGMDRYHLPLMPLVAVLAATWAGARSGARGDHAPLKVS